MIDDIGSGVVKIIFQVIGMYNMRGSNVAISYRNWNWKQFEHFPNYVLQFKCTIQGNSVGIMEFWSGFYLFIKQHMWLNDRNYAHWLVQAAVASLDVSPNGAATSDVRCLIWAPEILKIERENEPKINTHE